MFMGHYIPVHCQKHMKQFLMTGAQISTVLLTEFDYDFQCKVANFYSSCYELHVRRVLKLHHYILCDMNKHMHDHMKNQVTWIFCNSYNSAIFMIILICQNQVRLICKEQKTYKLYVYVLHNTYHYIHITLQHYSNNLLTDLNGIYSFL